MALERPGKLSIVAYQATVKCDGHELRARIDEPPHSLDGQIVVRPVPRSLTLAELASDELLYDTLCSRLRRQPIQLELLLENGIGHNQSGWLGQADIFGALGFG